MIERLAEEFRRIVVDAGYRFGIYCNLDWYNNVISEETKKIMISGLPVIRRMIMEH